MAKYAIQIKKGEIQYSISSDDKLFIENIIEDFFGRIKKQTKPFEQISEPKLYAEKTQAKKSEAVFQTQKIQEELKDEPLNQSDLQEKSQFIGASTVEKNDSINKMVKSLFDKSAEDTLMNLNKSIKNLKKEDNDLSDLTDLLSPKLQHEEFSVQNIESFENGFNFNSILEDKINNPVYEEVLEQKVFNYDEFIKAKQPESLMDYLIITAYYMLENENIEQFQLKQLNAKLYNSMNLVVDRKTVQKAIEDGLLYVVSDGIQNDGAVEYALTQAGQEFYTNGHA